MRMYFLALTILTLPLRGAASDVDCPSAWELWEADPEAAEGVARACLAQAPDSVERLLALSKILGWSGRSEEALALAETAEGLAPGDFDVLAWKLRLLGWLGRYEEAEVLAASHSVEGEPPHAEWAQVRADLERWRRPIPRHRAGLLLQAGPVVTGNEGPGWLLRLRGDGWLGERFHLLGGMERHERGFAGGPELDTLLLAAGTLVLREGLTLEAGAGAAPNPSFSPVWNAHLEAGLALGGGFTAFARFWHLEFRGGGVEVLSPALRYDGAGFWASLRGWYAIEKEDSGLALLGQLGFDLPLRLGAWVGAGGGDRADYLVIRDAATERHLVWLTGISWSPGEGYVFSADYVGRHEAVADAEFYRHEILFGLLRRW